MSFISSFDIISVTLPDPEMFLYIPTSVADAAAVNPTELRF